MSNVNSASNGLGFAFGMMLFLVLELAVVIQVLSGKYVTTAHYVFFAYVAASCILQALGMVLVSKGNYRIGAILQAIVAVPHVLDLMGLLGLAGAKRAWDLQRTNGNMTPANAGK